MDISKIPWLKPVVQEGIILASASPRRIETLQSKGFEIKIQPSNFKENLEKSKFTPQEYVRETCRMKALDVQKSSKFSGLIISADTIVVDKGEIVEKPTDRAHASQMLKSLENPHTVLTAVTLLIHGKEHTFVSENKIWFSLIDDDVLETYLDTNEWADKSGGFGYQFFGAYFVERIEGDYYSAIGFPFSMFLRELKHLLDSE